MATGEQNNENSDLFFANVSSVKERNGNADELEDERLSQRPQAPPVPGASEALIEEDENAAALAELEDVPMAAKKKRTINRGPKLDAKRLLGARGLPALSSCFKEVKLKGKGHEEEDLNLIMSTFEHWAHRLYPKFTFDDCLEKIESLGHKNEIKTCIKRIRMGMSVLDDQNESTVITADGPAPDDAELSNDLNDDEQSSSYIDIFPAVNSQTAERVAPAHDEITDNEPSSQTSTSVNAGASATFPVGFDPWNYGSCD